MSHDGRSVLIASTTDCRIFRHWLAGPKAGTTEIMIDELPGNPDNINRASDGNYWLALVGIRTPSFDLSMRKAGFPPAHGQAGAGRRMAGARASTMAASLKFDEAGNVLESYWDPTGVSHSTVTSMREHKGYLYLGGLENNRIGRIRLEGADPTWTGFDGLLG